MAAPFDASNASIYGDYLQLSGSGTAAPTGSSRGLSFLFASSSTGELGDTRLYLVNGSGSASKVTTEADAFNFTVAGDSGANQAMTDGNTLTLAGGDGLRSVGSATDTITFHMDINGLTALTSVADADTLAIDDNNSDDIKRITRAHLLGSALAAFDNGLTTTTLSATGDVDLGDATSDTITATGRFDSDLVPSTDSARDLGTSALQWAAAHVDVGHIDQLGSALDANSQAITNVDINSGAIDGTVIGAASAAAGTFTALVAGGDVDLGDATSDTITATGRFDSDLVPSTDSARDLGTSALQWAELHVDTGHIDQLGSALDANSQAITNVDINSGNIDGTVIGASSVAAGSFAAVVGTTATFSSTLAANGDVDLGNATSDTITATGRFDSDLVPSTDGARDLGTSTLEWKDLYLDGTAYVDSLQADALGADLNAAGFNITNVKQFEVDGTIAASGSIQAAQNMSASVGMQAGTLTIASFAANWTNAGRTVADLGAVTTVDINGGSVDGTVIGAASAAAGTFAALVGTSLSVSDGDITNVGDIALDSISADGTSMDIDLTDNQSAALEIKENTNVYMAFSTANGSEAIMTNKPFVPGSDNAVALGGASLRYSEGHINVLHADSLGQALDCDNQNMTNVDIDSGAIDGAVIGAASAAAGTFTALVAGGDVDLGDATSDTITATGRFDSDLVPSTDSARALGSATLQWSAAHVDVGHIDQLGSALDANSQAITNVDINSGAIDGTVIGAASAAAGSFTSAVATSLSVSDGDITNVGDIALDSISADGNEMDITLTDNQSAALEIKEGSTVYLAFSTANGQEAIAASKSFVPGSDNAISFGAASMRWSQGHIVALHADQLGQALDGNSQNATGFGNLYGSALSGSVSVGGGAGTLATLAVAGGTVSGDVALALPSGKDVKARAFVTYSERSLKTNIQPMNNALDTVKKMQGVTYDLKNSGKNEVGFIADEMAQVVPEVCQFKDDGTAAGLDYGRLTSVLVEAIKSQQAQIEELTSKLNK